MPLTMPKYTKQVGPPESAGFDKTRPWLPFREAEGMLKTSGQIVEKGQKALAETEAFNEKIKIANQTTTLENAQTRMAVGISDHMQTLQGRTDYQNFMPETAKFFGDLQKEFSDNIQDEEVLELIQNDFELQAAKTRGKVIHLTNIQADDRGRADYQKNLGIWGNRLSDPDPEIRTEAFVRGSGLIESAAQAGYIKFEDAEKTLQTFTQDARVTDAYAYALEFEGIAPDSGVKWLENPENTPGLNNDLRMGAVKELKRVIGLNRAEEEKAQKAIDEKLRDDVFKVIEAENVTAAQLTGIRKQVVALDLPIGNKMKAWLVDRIDRRIEAFTKGEKNPFEEYDPETHAILTGKIYTKAGREELKAEAAERNMSVDLYIHSFNKGGKKDSILASHSKTFIKDFNKFEKPKKEDKITNPEATSALTTLTDLWKDSFFIGQKKAKKKLSSLETIENNAAYGAIVNRFKEKWTDPENKKPAQDILNEILEPYYRKKMRTDLDKVLSWIPFAGLGEGTYRVTDRYRAISQLIQDDKPVTEEWITWMLEKGLPQLGQ